MLRWFTPNLLTWLRIAATPAVGLLLHLDQPWANVWAFWLFLAAALTDAADGSLARLRNQTTSLGALLDPIADKLLVTVALVLLTANGYVSGVAAALILSREFVISIGRQAAALEGVPLPVNIGGKTKTVLQMVALSFLILNHRPWGVPTLRIGSYLLWAAVAVAWLSCIVYIHAALRALKRPK